MLKKIFVAFGISILCGVAQAQSNYFGGSVAFLDYAEDDINIDGANVSFDEASLTAIYGRLGAEFNDNFSGEIRAGIGVSDDAADILVDGVEVDADVDIELDNMYGAYFRGGVQVGPAFFPYAIVGYTRGKVTATFSAPGFDRVSDSETESDTSFGLGADFNLTDNLLINVEYMNYFDKDNTEIDGFSVGLAANF